MKLSKKSIPYKAARDLGVIGIALLFTSGSSITGLNLAVAAILSALLIFSYAALLGWEYLVWKNYDYFLEDGKFKFKEGVLRKKEREIPLRRIQNVDLRRNIVHRVIGLAKLELETAGGNTTEASLKYVSPEHAEKIREHVKSGRNTSEEKKEGETEGEPVYTLSDRNLVIFSATNLDIATMLGIFAVMGFFLTGMGAAVERFGIAASLLLSVLALGALIVAFGTNFVKNFERYYGFKLWRNKDSLRYERGLLNRQEGTIPLDKIQDLKLEENFLKRPLGFATLKIETAGYSGEKASKKGSKAALPLDTQENVVKFAEDLENFKMPEIEPIAKKSRRRYFGRYSIALGTIPVAGALTGSVLASASLFLVLMPLAGMAAHLKYRNRGYAVSRQHLLTMNGFWNRKTMIVPYYRVQNLIKSQRVFQKRFSISSLTVDIAGTGFMGGNPVIHDLDSGRSEKVGEEIYSRFRESLRDHSSM